MSFWEHLDELRAVLIRCIACLAFLMCALFALKNQLFDIILAPSRPDFFLFHDQNLTEPVLINTQLTGQFFVHIQTSFFVALLLATPYILYNIFAFIAPALYTSELRAFRAAILSGSILFYVGIAMAYFVIFPVSFRFLIDYQVDAQVANTIQISSYVDTLITLSLLMGLFFELPVVAIMLAKLNVINAHLMANYRRHAIVGLLVVAAVVTPTTDILTLLLVALPIYLLYEASIIIVRLQERKKRPVH